MSKQINHNEITYLRRMVLGLAIAMFCFFIIAFFSGFLVDLKNINNFKNAYEVEAVPIGTELPHIFASDSSPCVVYEFIDKNGVTQSARMYNQMKKEEADKIINAAESVTLKYSIYLYPLNYKATLGVGSYVTIICFFISILSFCGFLFMIGKQRDPSRVVALGKKKIEVTVDGNLIQVFNAPTRLSLLVNGETVEFYDGLVAPRFTLTTEINTEEGIKTITLAMGFLFLRLYCNNVLLAKKFAGFG